MTAQGRNFLFLQGPHGPFFARLAKMLTAAGGEVWRVGFNAGDRAFWHSRARYIPFRAPPKNWPAALERICAAHHITDLVLYGDTRPIHAEAITYAKANGLTVHVFEEGYLRPYWVTYERGGSNGHSRLMQLPLAAMQSAHLAAEEPEAPAVWGDMRQHVFYGALYHWFVLFLNQGYRDFCPHRGRPLWREALSYTRKLLLMPLAALERGIASARIRRSGHPFHLALMQLDHDANFINHGPFSDMAGFTQEVIDGFARGAPPHHRLVFKTHPLESQSISQRRTIRAQAVRAGIAKRVHFVRGGKLAALLNHARSALTVNSTAGQQVLWRGIPLKTFGAAVYAKPGLVAEQNTTQFFAAPQKPNVESYRMYRKFLLETSQLPGGFYSRKGRSQLLRHVVDRMLCPTDPYARLISPPAPQKQHLRLLHR